ncbi:MAG TPA: UDP-2,3-diacylglucosamine diphosphatase [Burkholderiales bacterium]|nr:UDP-2,3-diacylglucosamine diphosphatase [Burkholderiales bacterium]
MPYSVFISDLHLCTDRPAINQTFFDFLQGPAAQAEALYILGDLFEYWAGDDDDDPFDAAVIAALRALADRGVALQLMHGNRDFLISEQFATASGVRLLPDPTLIDLYGTPTLLMHGDTLCTDDVEYQKFRTQVRDPAFQQKFLERPLAARKQEIARLRAQSETSKKAKTEEIMDVAPAAVEAALRRHGYPRLIHGHTHRPAHHEHIVDGHRCERWVLADWYRHGSYLRCDAGGCTSVNLG